MYCWVAVDAVPEFLLKDEDEDDDDDIDVDPCTLSPTTEPPWPLMSSAIEQDGLPAVDDILSTFTGISSLLLHCWCALVILHW